MEEKNRLKVVILVAGWGDMEKYVEPLKEKLVASFEHFFFFRYSYNKEKFQGGSFESIETLSNRLYSFIKNNNLMDPLIELNFVGYSYGGMLILYTLGRNLELCKNVGKIVSISAPHGGAFVEGLRDLASTMFYGIKDGLFPKLGTFGKMFSALMDFTEPQLSIFGITNVSENFLKDTYPNTIIKVFEAIPKERILEIYSEKDKVAPPESCRRFEEKMQLFPVNAETHQDVPKYQIVIDKVIEFFKTKYLILNSILDEFPIKIPGTLLINIYGIFLRSFGR